MSSPELGPTGQDTTQFALLPLESLTHLCGRDDPHGALGISAGSVDVLSVLLGPGSPSVRALFEQSFTEGLADRAGGALLPLVSP